MVRTRDRDPERPPLSVILPRFYLGAERDVTQDRLASLDISYVLSVNRCSPQPSFLPRSRYLRIPIDDSLWDDLLPWIPQALHFIDAAMSSGASVLVHCAAGISRSPALAVAYIVYSLGMDLDHAYRFVKERRPSISPNFNFLGQLQHFQGTLRQNSDFLAPQLDRHPPPISPAHHATPQQPSAEETQAHTEDFCHTDKPQQGLLHGEGDQQPSLSGKRQTLNLTLSPYPQEAFELDKPAPKPAQLQVPAGSVSLLEKRKSLSLCLTPLGTGPPSPNSSGGGSCRRAEDGLREQGQSRGRCGVAEAKERGLLSPLSFTLNKLLGWGERVLLGGVLVQPVRTGQPALQYRC